MRKTREGKLSIKYLFFDIESSDGTHGICEFSYVITDEQFNIVEEKETLVNPDFMFIRDERKAPLYYPHEIYLAAPKFPYHYEMIKNLLARNNMKIFGFSVGSDIDYLEDNCIRYGLEPFNFKAYDIQRIHTRLNGTSASRQLSLEEASTIIPYEERKKLTAHRAIDDAKMTMLILKYLVSFKGLKIDELIKGQQFLLDGLTRTKVIIEKKKWRDEHPSMLKWKKLARKTDKYMKNVTTYKLIYSVSDDVKNDERLLSKIVAKFKSNKKILATNNLSRANYHVVKVIEPDKEWIHKSVKLITVDEFLSK